MIDQKRLQQAPVLEVVTSLPNTWEEQQSFHEHLYEWMGRAPWIALSIAAHLLVALVLMAIPWELIAEDREKAVLIADIAPESEAEFLEPPPPVIEELEPVVVEDPVLQHEEVSQDQTDLGQSDTADTNQSDWNSSDSFFEASGTNDVIGIGAGAGAKFGPRGLGRGPGKAGTGVESTVRDGLLWLQAHQSADGSWDGDGFMGQCGTIAAGNLCSGPGEALHDVGLTGLALLAFLGDGNTTSRGPYKEVVARGIRWLKLQQDPDTGLLGDKIGHAYLYNHAIATLAICEAYYFSRSPLLKRCAQDAVNLITTARVPYGAWRYHFPPEGDSDTSITGWMVFALKAAEEAGLSVDPDAYTGALAWLDEVSDPSTGRAGYTERGGLSSRIANVNDQWPRETGEAMTAVALLTRFFLGQDPAREPIMEKHALLLRAKQPQWDAAGRGIDFYYWYYGIYAMFQMGTFHGVKYWDEWQAAMKVAVLQSQSKNGDEKGSWDPALDAWGSRHGGRVYTTAMGVLCLEVYFRYSRLVGSR